MPDLPLFRHLHMATDGVPAPVCGFNLSLIIRRSNRLLKHAAGEHDGIRIFPGCCIIRQPGKPYLPAVQYETGMLFPVLFEYHRQHLPERDVN